MDKYQFLKEEERLDYTLQTLNEEILNYIEKRKEIANYILDYRKNFIEEHKDDEDGNFYGIMTLCIEKMGEDNFFDLIGLNKMLGIEPEQKKEPKKPQDHKKKTAKAEVTEK